MDSCSEVGEISLIAEILHVSSMPIAFRAILIDDQMPKKTMEHL